MVGYRQYCIRLQHLQSDHNYFYREASSSLDRKFQCAHRSLLKSSRRREQILKQTFWRILKIWLESCAHFPNSMLSMKSIRKSVKKEHPEWHRHLDSIHTFEHHQHNKRNHILSTAICNHAKYFTGGLSMAESMILLCISKDFGICILE